MNLSAITVNNRARDRFWIGFRRLILADRPFILFMLVINKGVLTPDLKRKTSVRGIKTSDGPVWWAKRHYAFEGISDGKRESLSIAVGRSFYHLPSGVITK